MKTYWDDDNPWRKSVVYVPIEELVMCLAHLGAGCRVLHEDGTESRYIMTPQTELSRWLRYGNCRDAYILPQPSGHHSGGIRFGSEPEMYLSPYFDRHKLQDLLNKYQPSNRR